MTLTQMVKTLLHKFFQDKHKRYKEENMLMGGNLKKYNPQVPDFLKQRPPKFIAHCMQRIEMSKDCGPVVEHDEGYNVGKYLVAIGDEDTFPRCTCPDFRQSIWPCKHMFRAITDEDKIDWNRLSPLFRASPYLNVDSEVIDDLTEFYDVHLDLNNQASNKVDQKTVTETLVEKGVNTNTGVSTKRLQSHLRENLEEIKKHSYLIDDISILELLIHDTTEIINLIPKTTGLQLNKYPLKLRKTGKRRKYFDEENRLFQVETDEFIDFDEDYTLSLVEADEIIANNLVKRLWQMPRDYDIPVAKVLGDAVTDTDIRSLRDFGWLTDNIIDCYLKMISTWECDRGNQTLHLKNSQINLIVNDSLQSVNYKLSDYKTVIGVYNRSGHWMLIVADMESSILYFYNPIREMENDMETVLIGWRNFIQRYSARSGDKITNDWTVSSKPHARQIDGYNCGVYCLMFAEKHLENRSMLQIDKTSLREMREKVATKMMLFEEYLTDCCPKCGCQLEDDEKMQCYHCRRYYHFKPYCIEEDITGMDDTEMFKCRLCRINFWPIDRRSKDSMDGGKTVKWTQKEKVLTKLKENSAKDPLVKEIHFEKPIKADEKKFGFFKLKNEDNGDIKTGSLFARRADKPTETISPVTGAADIRAASTLAGDTKLSPGSPTSESSIFKHSQTSTEAAKPSHKDIVKQNKVTEVKTEPSEKSSPKEKKYPERIRKKRLRSSFVYAPLKKESKIFCICQKPNDGELYWQCEKCHGWFHPACVEMSESLEPATFFCPNCIGEPSEKKSDKTYDIPSMIIEAFDEEDKKSERDYLICAKMACKHMGSAVERGKIILEDEGTESNKPWMKSHREFVCGKRAMKCGYGYAIISFKAIECVRYFLRKRFITYRRAYSMSENIVHLKNEVLRKEIQQDNFLATIYVNDVLVKEALALIMQLVTGCTYEDADTECKLVLNKSKNKATLDAVQISAAKKIQLIQKFNVLL